MSALGGAPTAFISYSHDSPEHAGGVLALSNRLRKEGVDCEIDQYQVSPPEGWPRWMERNIRERDYTLVVCTEPYLRRVNGTETPGVGLGAKWEGAVITQELYEAEGMNSRFLPVVFGRLDLPFIPGFLRGATYYDLSQADGYEALYRRLTDQPRIVRPEVGSLRALAASSELQHSAPTPKRELALLLVEKEGLLLAQLDRAEMSKELELRLRPLDASGRPRLEQLRDGRSGPVGIAFGETALLGRPLDVRQEFAGGVELWTLRFAPEASDYGAGFMEMGTDTYSADDFAEFRARRILLDERLEDTPLAGRSSMDRAFLDLLVRGQSSPIQVSQSPLPALYSNLQGDPSLFLAAARLTAVLWLRLSGVVEHVTRLDMKLSDDSLEIDFRGLRARKYTNQEPVAVSVTGLCKLAPEETRRGGSA